MTRMTTAYHEGGGARRDRASAQAPGFGGCKLDGGTEHDHDEHKVADPCGSLASPCFGCCGSR
jgi:hypothetical protein